MRSLPKKLAKKILQRQPQKKSEAQKIKIYDDDVFLVSYPKSGNTWIRFIIANLIKSDPGEEIDFHSTAKYIPELGVHNQFLAGLPRPRIIKSHQLFNECFKSVVYIIRDPRDVYVSYYHYLKKRLPSDQSFSDFLREETLSPSRWHTHVESWADMPNVKYFLRYEDLLVNPEAEITKLLNSLDGKISFASNEISKAVEKSSFSNMKKIEQEKGRYFLSESAKKTATPFVRKGAHGDWKNYFSKSDEEFLLEEVGDLMQKFGYI